jgi:predicted ATP-grasp superfamily ATP-dependent carboligase
MFHWHSNFCPTPVWIYGLSTISHSLHYEAKEIAMLLSSVCGLVPTYSDIVHGTLNEHFPKQCFGRGGSEP